MANKRCGTCKFWPAKVDKNGRRIFSGNPSYLCKFEFGPAPVMPTCVPMTGYGAFKWPPDRRYTDAKDGENCPFWHA